MAGLGCWSCVINIYTFGACYKKNKDKDTANQIEKKSI